MKRIRLAIALWLSISVMAVSGCEFLPSPFFTETTTPTATTSLPPGLEVAAQRVLPSVVIVDTPFATGTGWVFDSNGIIVTNAHVIEGARIIVITMHDGRRFNVSRAASDAISDLAVLYVNATDLPAVAIGSSGALKIGDPVVAVGNSNGEGISVKTGNVTHLNMTVGIENEQYYGLIENNAPIQEGDSGGPLVNRDGEVVGISNAKVIGIEEISYAINIDSALPLLNQLLSNGFVNRAYLGITGRDNPNGPGVLITDIAASGPAEAAGLLAGDVIIAVDDIAIPGMTELQQAIRSKAVGQSVTITYHRGDAQGKAIAVLIQYPTL